MPERIYYAIALNVTTLFALTADAISGNFDVMPHPNTYAEYAEESSSGAGRVVGCGFPSATWHWPGPMEAIDMRILMDIIGSEPDVECYISTRTNQVTVSNEYTYAAFRCVMHRPEFDSIPPYRYENVTVRFTRLVPI